MLQETITMKHKAFLMGFVLGAILVASLAFALSSGSASDEKVTIRVIEHADTDVVTETGAEGDSVGDILTFANPVFDENDAEQVGSDQGWCIRLVVGESWECFWTIFLADGQITVEGPFYDAKESVLAITGGTGKYQNARGQMSLKAANEDATKFEFVYELYDAE
jgi:hypothetical protein